MFPACSPRLLETGPPLRTPDDLRHHALIHDTAADRDPLAPTWPMWLKAAGVKDMPATAGLTFTSGYMALDAAIAGHGVVLAYSTIAAADLAAGRLVRLFSLSLPDLFAYYIVTAPGARERPKVRAFRNWLRQEADCRRAGSVPEVAEPGEHHRDPGAVGGFDHLRRRGASRRAGSPRWRRPGSPLRARRRTGRRRPTRRPSLLSPAPAMPALAAASAAFCAAMRTLSTRLIWPAPMPTVAPPRAKTIAFDLTCFATVSANKRSAISASVGARFVTTLRSSREAVTRSRSWISNPPASSCVVQLSAFGSGRPSGDQQPQRLLAGEDVAGFRVGLRAR